MTRRERGPRALSYAVVAAATLVLAGGGTAFGGPVKSRLVAKSKLVAARPSFEHGRQVFFEATFDGNGRTCATCHDPRNEFTISPALVQERFALDPGHPLFRPIDSDAEDGASYATVLAHAVFRVRVPLHDKIVNLGEPQRRTLKLWRGVPSITNVALTAPYQQDGRAVTLQSQARGAIRDHMQPARRQFSKEAEALKTFLVEIFGPQSLRALATDPDPVPLAPGFSLPLESPAALRGKVSFDLHCRRCHGGEHGGTSEDPTVGQFANVFVSDVNLPGFPFLHLGFGQPDGSLVEVFTPDPGRAAITGDLADLNAFDIPPLRGVKLTAPYFHDNSLATLREVVEHYNNEFNFRILNEDLDDLLAYLEAL